MNRYNMRFQVPLLTIHMWRQHILELFSAHWPTFFVSFSKYFVYLRGDFNIHGTKNFYDAKYLWCCKPPVPLVGQIARPLHKYWHCWLLLKMPSEGVFSNKRQCQHFMERTGFFAHQRYRKAYNIISFWFLMENSTLEIFGSMDVKITPDFCS